MLTKLIYSLDDEILIDACWAISYLSDGSNDKIQAVIESGVCRRLVDLLLHPSTSVQTPALRSVGNIVTGDDLQTQVVIASGALGALLSLLSSPKEGIRKEACWTISNITAGSPPQIQAVVDANIIPPLINILRNADFKTKKEACWALSNATSGGLQEPSQIRYLVSQGCIGPLCELLNMMDNKIIQVALDGLDNILKVGELDRQAGGPGAVNQYAVYVEEAGGMVTIHNLQQHDNLEIYKKAFNIMDKYFPDEEDVDAGIAAPNVDASGAFAVGRPNHIVLQRLLNNALSSSIPTWQPRRAASALASSKGLFKSHPPSSLSARCTYFSRSFALGRRDGASLSTICSLVLDPITIPSSPHDATVAHLESMYLASLRRISTHVVA